jgi:hypothetical protein
LFLSL